MVPYSLLRPCQHPVLEFVINRHGACGGLNEYGSPVGSQRLALFERIMRYGLVGGGVALLEEMSLAVWG